MTNFMTYVVNNWELVAAFIIVCISIFIVVVQKIQEFLALPTAKRKAEVKARLLVWVVAAQREWGSDTNIIKLSDVYGKFCEAFPYLKKWISIDQFNEYVKEALVTMHKLFEDSTAKANALSLPAPVIEDAAPVTTTEEVETPPVSNSTPEPVIVTGDPTANSTDTPAQ